MFLPQLWIHDLSASRINGIRGASTARPARIGKCAWILTGLRKERLAKLRASMKANDLGALVLFAGANIRYATASYQGNWKYNINIRYAVVPHDAANPFCLKPPAPTCTARKSICRGWKAAFARPSPGSGPKAPCRTWPGAWPRASWTC